MSKEDISLVKRKSETPLQIKKAKRILLTRRQPSIIIPERKMKYITADKTTCAECTCFPTEDAYSKRPEKKLLPCQRSPRPLYEITAEAVDKLPHPAAFDWTEHDVADWMQYVVGLPEYRGCILDNHIDGMRLLMLEDPSKLPHMNIHYFSHIKMITSAVRKLFSTDFIRFVRSISLPPRTPLVLITWFKSRTGPSWGIRRNWTGCKILRWLNILMPEPLHLDHWDLVWYQKPDFPKVMFGRVPPVTGARSGIPRHNRDKPSENMVRRKFIIIKDIPEEDQYIWIEPTVYTPFKMSEKENGGKSIKPYFLIKENSSLLPKNIKMEGLKGKDLVLARRKMPKPKFLDIRYKCR